MAESTPVHILMTGAGKADDEELISALRSSGYAIRIEPWHAEVPALVESETFDAIVVRLPLPGVGLGVLLSSIRARAARCRGAGLVILTPDDDIRAVEKLIGRGVNRVLPDCATPREVLEAVEHVQGAAQRISIRLPVQLEVTLPAGESMAYCQTENVSETGMLLRGFQHYLPGTQFSFRLQIPGTDQCLEGIAEVTRTTDAGRESVEGFGARFVEMNSSDRQLLDQIFGEEDETSN